MLVPVDEAGAFHEPYGWLHGKHTSDVTTPIVEDLGMRGRLLRAGEMTHRFPVCWRCGTELIFRVVDEWFISADGVRERMLAANQTVKWVPEHYGKRMDDWLRNMGDWCISRKRYWGLPLPFYVAPSGELTVVGSVAELRERAVDSLDGLEELHRPWIDGIRIRTDAARSPSACRRSATAGSTRASSRSRPSAGAATSTCPRGTPRAPARG